MKGHKENLYVDMKALKINNTTHTVVHWRPGDLTVSALASSSSSSSGWVHCVAFLAKLSRCLSLPKCIK